MRVNYRNEFIVNIVNESDIEMVKSQAEISFCISTTCTLLSATGGGP